MVTTQHKNRCPGGQGIQIFCRAFLFIFIMYSVCLTCARLCPRVERIHQIQTFYSKIILPWDDGSLNLLIRVSLCYRRYILMLLTRCRRRTSYYDRPIIQHLSDSGNLKVLGKSYQEHSQRLYFTWSSSCGGYTSSRHKSVYIVYFQNPDLKKIAVFKLLPQEIR